jgi:hypothetical protein
MATVSEVEATVTLSSSSATVKGPGWAGSGAVLPVLPPVPVLDDDPLPDALEEVAPLEALDDDATLELPEPDAVLPVEDDELLTDDAVLDAEAPVDPVLALLELAGPLPVALELPPVEVEVPEPLVVDVRTGLDEPQATAASVSTASESRRIGSPSWKRLRCFNGRGDATPSVRFTSEGSGPALSVSTQASARGAVATDRGSDSLGDGVGHSPAPPHGTPAAEGGAATLPQPLEPSMRRILCALVGFAISFTAGCAKPLPPERQSYVGYWQADDHGEHFSLGLSGEGQARYVRTKPGSSEELNLPVKSFTGDSFDLGMGPISTHFEVQQAPHLDQGQWTMTVDGHVYTRAE